MRTDSADQVLHRAARADGRGHLSGAAHKRPTRSRMPSTSGYMVAAGVGAAALFSVLWWMLLSGGDEAPWVLAGLAACVVMLVAVAAREVVMRRAWTRYILEQDRQDSLPSSAHVSASSLNETRKSAGTRSINAHSSAMRTIQKRSATADASNGQPEPHLEVYHLCKDYLASTDETLRSSAIMTESRAALRAGQERVRTLQKHHLLMWARNASRVILHEAELRARISDKIETAQRALDCLDAAIKLYPEETNLNESVMAVREFIASVKVARWVEMAERAAFKGHYRRAIDRYRDALFYLSREEMREETRMDAAERINREISMLRARLSMLKMDQQSNAEPSPKSHQRTREDVEAQMP